MRVHEYGAVGSPSVRLLCGSVKFFEKHTLGGVFFLAVDSTRECPPSSLNHKHKPELLCPGHLSNGKEMCCGIAKSSSAFSSLFTLAGVCPQLFCSADKNRDSHNHSQMNHTKRNRLPG